jgi:hypothetical protein
VVVFYPGSVKINTQIIGDGLAWITKALCLPAEFRESLRVHVVQTPSHDLAALRLACFRVSIGAI